MKVQSYARLTIGILVAWFTFALIGAALGIFKAPPGRPPIPIALATSIPLALFVIWFAASRGFRNFVLSLNPRVITLVHSWRLVGYAFLVLYAYRILPGMFALPAAWGDIFIGATAPLVALKFTDSKHLKIFALWQIFGMIDLVNAVAMAATTAIIRPNGIGPDAMAVLPLSVIPTFGVPLFLILHLISLAQAWRWKELPSAETGRDLLVSA